MDISLRVRVRSEINFIEQSDILVFVHFNRPHSTNRRSLTTTPLCVCRFVGPFAHFVRITYRIRHMIFWAPIFASIQSNPNGSMCKWKTIVNAFNATHLFYALSIVHWFAIYITISFSYSFSFYHSHKFTLFYDFKSLFVRCNIDCGKRNDRIGDNDSVTIIVQWQCVSAIIKIQYATATMCDYNEKVSVNRGSSSKKIGTKTNERREKSCLRKDNFVWMWFLYVFKTH